MKSSRAAVDLIITEEVSSKAVYEKKYQRPEWPGGASGITVGIGYDLGYSTPDQIVADWKDYLTPDVIREMQKYAGLTGQQAHAVLGESREHIVIPWNAAMAVFMKHDMPKWESRVLKACPGSDKLPAGCFGVLTSLAYNRGASFTKAGDRYEEMRAIRAHVNAEEWDKIPDEIRNMKRLWPDVTGLRDRRDHEAALWERSLAAWKPGEEPSGRVTTGDDKDAPEVTPEGNEEDHELNVQRPHAGYSLEVETIQRELISMGYHEVGEIDGLFGGKFVAGVSAFMTDRGKDPNRGRVTPELKSEIEKAKTELLPSGKPWSRPISPKRANATVKDIEPKVAPLKAAWYQKVLAWILGIPSAIAAAFKGLFGDQDHITGYIQPFKDVFGAIPSEMYWLAGVAMAVAIFLVAKKAQDATVKAYQEGKIN